jgi:hypothetical protein
MPIKISFSRVLFIGLLFFGAISAAGMESDHFKITTSVISGGGALIESESFLLKSTLGQSTPLMDPADPPYSDSFDAYPGYWFTVAPAVGGYCDYDFEPDGDVDGLDLVEFIQDLIGGLVEAGELANFADEFGRSPCLE